MCGACFTTPLLSPALLPHPHLQSSLHLLPNPTPSHSHFLQMRDDELAGSNTDGSTSTSDKKFQTSYPAEVYGKTRKLRQARRDADHSNENRIAAQTATTTAQSALAAVKNTVKDLTRRIEVSKAAQPTGRKQGGKCSELDELEKIKQDTRKLKLDIACVWDEKRKAEKEKDYYLSRAESQQRSVEALAKEIAESNEEHVLVELARIQAVKECEQVESQRREKALQYLAAIQEARTKKQQLIQEIRDVEELEKELFVTESDASVLATELNFVKEMDPNPERGDSEPSSDEQQDESVLEKLKAAKKELASIKEGGFQLMASMDGVRREREHIRDEIARLKKSEEKSEATIQNLNSKLLRSKAKLEAAIAAEEKAKSIASTQSFMLEQLWSEADAAMKEHSLISEETAAAKEDLQRAENAMALAEDKLHAALQLLKAAKLSEATALENLKQHTEKTMRSRDSAPWHSSRITISRFEYEYLTGHAAGADEIADMKVAAAEAWIEALRASEKELQIIYQQLKNQSRELKAEEDNEVKKGEEPIHESKTSEVNEFEKERRTSMGTEKLKPEMSRKSIKSTKVSLGIARQRKAPGMPGSTLFTVKRRRKVMPNLAKFFRR